MICESILIILIGTTRHYFLGKQTEIFYFFPPYFTLLSFESGSSGLVQGMEGQRPFAASSSQELGPHNH